MENSKIEWTASPRPDGTLAPGHTGNLWLGCTEVHAGCDNCYARVQSQRWGRDVWGKDKPRVAVKKVWGDFMRWQALAHAAGEVHRVFVGSMMDIFEKPMPVVDSKGNPILQSMNREINTGEIRDRFFYEIVPACPNLDFLLLTKRPSNINKYIPERWNTDPPDNVMFGTSPVDSETFRTLVPQLKKVNGRRFLSIEPQLGYIFPTRQGLFGIDWIIQGGESGHKKRPFNLSWARFLRDVCKANQVPYFFKQIDKIQEIPSDLMVRQFPSQPQKQLLK